MKKKCKKSKVFIVMAVYDLSDCVDINGESAGYQEEIKGVFKKRRKAEKLRSRLESENTEAEDSCSCDSVSYQIEKWEVE